MISTFREASAEALVGIAEEKRIRKTDEVFLLFIMGSQFDHLIKQRLERLGVFCLAADPAHVIADDVRTLNPKGIILSGGPGSAQSEPPPFDNAIFDLGIPVLGICLGFQMWAQWIGARVLAASKREYGPHRMQLALTRSRLFHGCPDSFMVLHSHGDVIHDKGILTITASTDNAVAAGECKHLYGVQFHPEVTHTEYGDKIFENFVFGICSAKDRYPAAKIAERKVAELREHIGDANVLLALSGGSDSSVTAYLLREAMRDSKGKLRGVYIKGIDRPDDERYVIEFFGNQSWIELAIVDATDRFLEAVKGLTSMREKRLAMRGVYKAVLEEQAALLGAAFIAQGTLYTDVSESGGGYSTGARKAEIKIHHNFDLKFSLPELKPLDDCVKDGARNIGREIGVPEVLLTRHPFPGPGLLIRVDGEVTAEKLEIARATDSIFIEELRKHDLYDSTWQASAIVINSQVTCTKGDDGVTGWAVALRAVWSVNGFTATAAELPWDFLHHVQRRIGNEIRHVGKVLYDISDKPYSTIEWG